MPHHTTPHHITPQCMEPGHTTPHHTTPHLPRPTHTAPHHTDTNANPTPHHITAYPHIYIYICVKCVYIYIYISYCGWHFVLLHTFGCKNPSPIHSTYTNAHVVFSCNSRFECMHSNLSDKSGGPATPQKIQTSTLTLHQRLLHKPSSTHLWGLRI